MKKVCLLTGNLIFREKKTGVHFHHEMIAKNLILHDREYEITIGCFDPKEELKEVAEVQDPWALPYSTFCKAHRVLQYLFPVELFFGKNDVYLCDGFFPHLMHRNSKRICLVHDLMVKIYPEYYSPLMRAYLNIFFTKLKKADLIVCSSENTKQDIIKYFGIKADKIKVTYSSWIPPFETLSAADVSKQIKNTQKFIFYIGDMRPNKNLLNTIKGFMQFCKNTNNKDLVFFIAGNKRGQYEELKELVNKNKMNDRIIFLGYISDFEKQYLYKNGKAVMLVSKYEGFGLPIMEGLYYGTPVITSNVSSMKEIGEGVSIQVDPYNQDEIANAIRMVYEGEYNPNQKMVSEKMKLYSFENVANVVDSAIKEVLG